MSEVFNVIAVRNFVQNTSIVPFKGPGLQAENSWPKLNVRFQHTEYILSNASHFTPAFSLLQLLFCFLGLDHQTDRGGKKKT